MCLFPACHCVDKYMKNPALSCKVSEVMVGPCFRHSDELPQVTCCEKLKCKYTFVVVTFEMCYQASAWSFICMFSLNLKTIYTLLNGIICNMHRAQYKRGPCVPDNTGSEVRSMIQLQIYALSERKTIDTL